MVAFQRSPSNPAAAGCSTRVPRLFTVFVVVCILLPLLLLCCDPVIGRDLLLLSLVTPTTDAVPLLTQPSTHIRTRASVQRRLSFPLRFFRHRLAALLPLISAEAGCSRSDYQQLKQNQGCQKHEWCDARGTADITIQSLYAKRIEYIHTDCKYRWGLIDYGCRKGNSRDRCGNVGGQLIKWSDVQSSRFTTLYSGANSFIEDNFWNVQGNNPSCNDGGGSSDAYHCKNGHTRSVCREYKSFWSRGPKIWRVACRRDRSAVEFISRGDYEDLYAPYAMSFGDAEHSCAVLKAELGTVADFAPGSLKKLRDAHWQYEKDRAWTGLYFNISSSGARTYGWRSGEPFHSSHAIINGFNNPGPGTFYPLRTTGVDGGRRFLWEGTNAHWAPFPCTRKKKSVRVIAHDRNIPTIGCYPGRQCLVQLKLAAGDVVHPSYTQGKIEPLKLKLQFTGVWSKVQWFTFAQGQGSSATKQWFTSSTPGNVNVQVHYRSLSSYKGETIQFAVKDKETVVFDTAASALPSPWFVGQTWSAVVKRSTDGFSPGTLVFCCDAAITNSFTAEWSGATRPMSLTPTVAGARSLQFTLPNAQGVYATPTPALAVDVKPQSTVTIAFTDAFAVVGLAAGFRVNVTAGTTVAATTSFDVAFSCPGSISPSPLQLTAGATDPVVVGTVTPGSIDAAQNCVLSLTASPVVPQFLAVDTTTVLVRPQLVVVATSLPVKATKGVNYTFTLSVSGVYTDAVTVTPSCGDATFTNALTFAAGNLTGQLTLLAPIASLNTSCDFTVAFSGAAAKYFAPFVATTVQYSDKTEIAAELNSTAVYVGEAALLTVSEPVQLTGSQTAELTWAFVSDNASLTEGLTGGSVVLSVGNHSARIVLDTDAVGAANITFTVTKAPVTFRHVISPLQFTVMPLLLPNVTVSLPERLTVGSAYAVTVSVAIPQLPHSAAVIVTPEFNGTAVTVSPDNNTWTAADSANDAAVFTVQGLAPCASAPVTFRVSGTATDFNTSAEIALPAGAPEVYTRATLSLVIRGESTIFGVAGNTLQLVVGTPTHALPVDLVMALSIPGDKIVSAPTNATIAAGTNETVISLVPHLPGLGIPFDMTAVVGPESDGNNATVLAEIHALTEALSVTATVLPARSFTTVCNTSELFFGAGNAFSCNITASSLPATGAVLLTAEDATSAGVVINPQAAEFDNSQLWLLFTVTPDPAAQEVTVSDGALHSVSFTPTDATSTFDTSTLTVDYTARLLKPTTLTANITEGVGLFVNVPFEITATLPQGRSSDVVVSPSTLGGRLSWTPPTQTVPAGDTAASVFFDCTAAVSGTIDLEVALRGELTMATSAEELSVTVSPRLVFSYTVTSDPVRGEGPYFTGQNVTFEGRLSAPLPAGAELSVAVGLACASGTVLDPASAGAGLSKATLQYTAETSDMTSVVFVTTPCVTGTSAADRVSLSAVLSGTALQYFDAPQAATFFVLPPRVIDFYFVDGSIYGGAARNSTRLVVKLPAAPVSNSELTVGITLASLTALQDLGTPVVASVAALAHSFTDDLLEEEHLREWRLAATLDTVTAAATATCVLSGTAASQYVLRQSVTSVSIVARLQVSVSGLPAAPLVASSVALVGQRVSANKIGTVRISIPELPLLPESDDPDAANAAAVLRVTPRLANAPPASVTFEPSVVEFNATSPLSATVDLYATHPTAADSATAVPTAPSVASTPMVLFDIVGTAAQYLPVSVPPAHFFVWVTPLPHVVVAPPPRLLYANRTAAFTVRLSSPSAAALSVDFAATVGVSLSPSTATWAPGTTDVKVITVHAPVVVTAASVESTVTVAVQPAPVTAVSPQASLESFPVVLLSPSTVGLNLPAFVYAIGQPVLGALTLATPITTFTALLEASPTVTGITQPVSVVPSVTRFDINTPQQRQLSLTAPAATLPQGSRATLAASVVVNLLGSATSDYSAPPSLPLQIRPREVVVVRGLPRYLYVGQHSSITVGLSRIPECSATAAITVTPRFPTPDAVFSPASATWGYGADSGWTVTFGLTAKSASASVVPVYFDLSGDCMADFSVVPDTDNAEGTSVLPLDTVSISFPEDAVRTIDGVTTAVAYRNTTLTATVTLVKTTTELNVPPHEGVSVLIEYLGRHGSVTATDGGLVTFSPGAKTATVDLNAALVSDAAPLRITVAGGPSQHCFSSPPLTAVPRLEVIRRIRATLAFNPAAAILVAGKQSSINVALAAPPPSGRPLTVALEYGPEVVAASTLTFASATPKTTQTFSVTPSAATNGTKRQLRIVLSGPGATAYEAFPDGGVSVAVLPQQSVVLSATPAQVYIGPRNTKSFTVSLSAPPTLAETEVTLRLSTGPLASFGVALLKLSRASPNATVTMTGTAPGTLLLLPFLVAEDASGEFASQPTEAVSGAATIPIRQLQVLVLEGYSPTLYVNGSMNVTLRVSALPTTGSVSIAVQLSNPSYDLTVSPASVVFASTDTALAQYMVITAAADATLPRTLLRFVSSGSTEFAFTAAEETLMVLARSAVGLHSVPETLFVGAVNKKTFSVLFPALPQLSNETITVEVSSAEGRLSFSPTSVILRSNSTTLLVGGVPVVPVTIEPSADALAGGVASATDTLTVSVSYNTALATVAAPPLQRLTILPLRAAQHSFSDVVWSGTQAVLYKDSVAYTDVTIAAAQGFAGVTVHLTVLKKVGGSSQRLIPVPVTEAFVPATSAKLSTAGAVRFEIHAKAAGITVELRYSLSGSDASTVAWPVAVSEQRLRFASRGAVTVAVPAAMYVGLQSEMSASLSAAPQVGTVSVAPVLPTQIFDPSAGSLPAHVWSSPTDALVWTQALTPNTAGVFSVWVYPEVKGTAAYDNTGQGFTVVVRQPTVISITGVPTAAYVAPNRVEVRVLLSTPLDPGETVEVQLHSNTSDIIVNPSRAVTISSTTAGRMVRFMVEAKAPTFARFHATFSSTVNRFVLSSGANSTTGPVAHFRALKQPRVVPGVLDLVVGQRATIDVVVDELPSPGHVLVASLKYFGSPANVQLPPAVQWTSSDTEHRRSLQVLGVSATQTELIRVVFSKDTEYRTSYTAAALALVQHQIRFRPKFNVDVSLPSSLFLNRDTAVEVRLSDTAPLTLSVSSTPPGIIAFTPPTITFAGGLVQTITAHATANTADNAPVPVAFALVGGDTVKFNAVPVAATTIIDSTTLLVKVPSAHMTLYVVPGFTVKVDLELGVDPNGAVPLMVVPLFVCPNVGGSAAFRAVPPSVNFTQGALQQTFRIHHTGVLQRQQCELRFSLQGNVGIFKPPSQLFTVIAREPHNVTLVDVPTRVFVGEANTVELKVALDSDSPLPLDAEITAAFTTGERCLTLAPVSLSWAIGSVAEPLTKSIRVTATCTGTALAVGVTINAASSKFLAVFPTTVLLDGFNPMDVKVTSSTFSGTSNVNYYMFLGSIPLTLKAELPEPLLDGEVLTVRTEYDGFVGSTSLPEATFSGGAAGGLSRSLIIEAYTVAPIEELRFVVTGPPRFAPRASGSGLLEVFGPLYVTVDFPTPLFENEPVTRFVEVQEQPFGSEVVVATPKWHGAGESMTFRPTHATWRPNSIDLRQPITLVPNERSEGYTLEVPVAGSTRYTPTAFNKIVEILPQHVVTLSGLPGQLTVGRTYTLTLNIGAQPIGVSENIRLVIIPQGHNSRQCATVSATTLIFASDATAGGVEQQISVNAVAKCPSRELRVRVAGTPKSVRRYRLAVVPHLFTTVDPRPVELSWPLEAYAGQANIPEAFATLTWNSGILDGGTVSLLVTSDNDAKLGSSVTRRLEWTDGASSEQPLTVFTHSGASGPIVFSFTLLSSIPAINGTLLDPVTTTFLPLLNLTRDDLPETMYSGPRNRLRLMMRLSAALGRPQNTQPLEVTVTPRSSSPFVSFVPAMLKWTSGGRFDRPLYIEGAFESPNVTVSFDVAGSGRSALWALPSPANISVLAKLNVTFTDSPSEIYVGEANAQPVELTAPPGVALSVRFAVDGEPSAIAPSPSVLEWTEHSPRTQVVSLRAVYSTLVQCRVRYEIVTGPPFVGMALVADPAKTLIRLLPLKPITRTPAEYHIRFAELSDVVISFSPAVHITCNSSDPTLVLPVNPTLEDSSSSQNASSTAAAVSAGTISLKLLLPGTVEVTCAPTDTTYATPSSFLVTSTARKRVTLSNDGVVTTFAGSALSANVGLNNRPNAGTLVVTPVLDPNTTHFVTVSPPTLLFPVGGVLLQTFTFSGNRTTGPDTPVHVHLRFDGPVAEYRLPDPPYFRVVVRPQVTLSASMDPSTGVRFATLKQQKDSGIHDVYVGSGNGFISTVALSGPTLSGSVGLRPYVVTRGVLSGGSYGVEISPPPPALIVFTAGTATLEQPVRIMRAGASPPGMTTELWIRVESAPNEFTGATDVRVATVRFVDLETYRITNPAALPSTLFLGTANQRVVELELSGFPAVSTRVSVSIAAAAPTRVQVRPSLIDFVRPSAAVEAQVALTGVVPPDVQATLTRSFTIIGRGVTPLGTPESIDVAWRQLPDSAANVATASSGPSRLQTRVSSLFNFDVKCRTAPVNCDSITFYTTQANSVFLDVSVSGLPLDAFDTFTVNITVPRPELLTVSPPTLVFSRSQHNGATSQLVALSGVDLSAGSQRLAFKGIGAQEFQQHRTEYIDVVTLPLRQFEIEGMPDTVPIGLVNKRTIRLRPKEAAFVSLRVYSNCAQMSFTAVGSSTWGGTQEWQSYEIAATGPTDSCVLFADVVGGADGTKYKPKQISQSVTAVPRPVVSFASRGDGFLLDPADVVAGTVEVTIQLSGDGFYKFDDRQLYDGTVQENATMTVTSSYSRAEQPAGVAWAVAVAPSSFFGNFRYSSDRTSLTGRIGPMRGFATTSKEIVTIAFRRTAIAGNILPEKGSVRFVVNGKPVQTVASTTKSVISNGANAAVAAGGILSLGAATQAGKLQTIMDAFYCPNPDWKLDQESMDWSEAPLPIAFGSVSDLGVYAAVGFGDSLIIFGFLALHLSLVTVIHRVRLRGPYHDKSWAASMALVRFPSISLAPVLFFVQAIVSAGVRTVLYSPVSTLRTIAAITLLFFGLGLPVLMYLRTGPGFEAQWKPAEAAESDEDTDDDSDHVGVEERLTASPKPEKEEKSKLPWILRWFLSESGRWDHATDYYWTMRNGAFFDEYRGGYQFWQVLDVLIVVVLGVLEGIVPKTRGACVVRNIVNIVIFFTQFIITVIFRPYRTAFGNVFFIVTNFLQFLSMLMVGIAFFLEDPQSAAFSISTQLLLLFSLLLFVKAVVDAVKSFREFTGIDKMLEKRKNIRFQRPTEEEEQNQVRDMTEQMHNRMRRKVDAEIARFEKAAAHINTPTFSPSASPVPPGALSSGILSPASGAMTPIGSRHGSQLGLSGPPSAPDDADDSDEDFALVRSTPTSPRRQTVRPEDIMGPRRQRRSVLPSDHPDHERSLQYNKKRLSREAKKANWASAELPPRPPKPQRNGAGSPPLSPRRNPTSPRVRYLDESEL